MPTGDREVIIADAEDGRRDSVRRVLSSGAGLHVRAVATPAALAESLEERGADVLFLDVAFFGAQATGQVGRLAEGPGAPDIIVLCTVDSVPAAMAAMRCGASDFVLRGHEAEDLHDRLARALQRRVQGPDEPRAVSAGGAVLGKGPKMRKVCNVLRRVAPLPVPVLLLGETGVGKDVFARLIHSLSPRAAGPFVPVNLAAIPAELVESTLFGHERGAFTGAVSRHTGKLEQADGGTLFLDEIGEMRPDLQTKLLRVLQERVYEPVGGREAAAADVRLVCATNVDLTGAISRGAFRKDLYYRINVVSLQIPPLRERREDLEDLVHCFVERYAKLFGRRVSGVSPAALEILASYSWPGNVRELENKIQRAIALATGPLLGAADFFDLDMLDPESFVQERSKDLLNLESVEEAYIRQVLLHVGHHQGDAARVLGIDRKTLYNKMVRYGLLTPKSGDGRQGQGGAA